MLDKTDEKLDNISHFEMKRTMLFLCEIHWGSFSDNFGEGRETSLTDSPLRTLLVTLRIMKCTSHGLSQHSSVGSPKVY